MPNMGAKLTRSADKKIDAVGESAAHYGTVPQATHSLIDALFTTTQQRVLGALCTSTPHGISVTELIASTGAGSGAAQRELAKLTASGLVCMQPIGNQKRYQLNAQSPIHAELVSIIRKTIGLAGPLRAALTPIAARITAAFVYGSVAKRSDTAASDIDVMIVAEDLDYATVFAALEPVAVRLARTINPTVYTRAELAKRIAMNNVFVTKVWAQPKLWLIGETLDLGACRTYEESAANPPARSIFPPILGR